MDFVLFLKLVHVAAAMPWVGGVATLALLVLLTDRKGDDAATLGAMALMGFAGRLAFSRLAPLTLGTGVLLAWLGGWGLAPWVVLSVLLSGLSFAYLKAVLAPGGARVVALRAKGDLAGAATQARRQLRRVGTNLCVKLAIIALMILKPALADPLLLVPAALLLLAAALHVSAAGRAPAAQPA